MLGRVLFVALFCIAVKGESEYSIPDVEVEAFKPKGFRVKIPDAHGILLFAAQGFVTKLDNPKKIEIGGETASKRSIDDTDYWVVDLPEVQLNVGDEVHYLVFVAKGSAGYIRDNLELKIEKDTLKVLVPLPALPSYSDDQTSTTTTTNKACAPTLTRVHSSDHVCSGDTIFEENFDSLREDVWQIQHYIPVDHPEHPFVSYQRSAVSIKDGNLHIGLRPQLNETESLYGSLDISDGCTSGDAHLCSVVASQEVPIPPVVSGRVISKPGFAFTYGTVSVRAKLPRGDWIYPEILLESLMNKFLVDSTNTGILKIASARGNANLPNGNKVLYGGPILHTKCHDTLLRSNNKSDIVWADDFHVYSVEWTPEHLMLSVDGQEYARVEPEENGLRTKLPDSCPGVRAAGIAPFNEHFYLTLGLAVGGWTEFSESNESNSPKPWMVPKASVEFWNSRQAWQSSWQNPELVVDYVKVVAL